VRSTRFSACSPPKVLERLRSSTTGTPAPPDVAGPGAFCAPGPTADCWLLRSAEAVISLLTAPQLAVTAHVGGAVTEVGARRRACLIDVGVVEDAERRLLVPVLDDRAARDDTADLIHGGVGQPRDVLADVHLHDVAVLDQLHDGGR